MKDIILWSFKKYYIRCKYCECQNDTSGVVMFVGDVIEFALMMERTDGILYFKYVKMSP